jgi:hypothetical protein
VPYRKIVDTKATEFWKSYVDLTFRGMADRQKELSDLSVAYDCFKIRSRAIVKFIKIGFYGACVDGKD